MAHGSEAKINFACSFKVFEGFQGTFFKKSPEWGLGQSPESSISIKRRDVGFADVPSFSVDKPPVFVV